VQLGDIKRSVFVFRDRVFRINPRRGIQAKRDELLRLVARGWKVLIRAFLFHLG
jgi:hypothetical protein